MDNISIESKLPRVETTIFTVMSALAREHNAINLSQGFPDFPVDERLIDLAAYYMKAGKNQYAPMPGIPELRSGIADIVKQQYGAEYSPELEITVTSGATEALFCAITALIHEGDEVLIFEPAYDSYGPAIELSGGVPVALSLTYPDYSINWEAVKKIINSRTKAIILNSPHNPTGSVLSESDLLELEKIISNNDIFIISDEVYEHIIFDGHVHQSIARFPGLAQRSFIISSFGKTFHATGWKIGYCLAPEKLTKEFRKVHQFVNFSTSAPMQYAIAEYLRDQFTITNLSSMYQKKRDFFLEVMEDSGFKPIPSKGTYFQLMSYAGLSDMSDYAFAVHLTKEIGVASIPISGFYRSLEDNKVLRFCFAKTEHTLERAAALLKTL